MKVYLDDVRAVPHGFDVNPKTAWECIAILKTGKVVEISFDHDLGDSVNGTGYDVACFIEEAAFNNEIPKLLWNIHSANPVGRKNIEQAMNKADYFWSLAGS